MVVDLFRLLRRQINPADTLAGNTAPDCLERSVGMNAIKLAIAQPQSRAGTFEVSLELRAAGRHIVPARASPSERPLMSLGPATRAAALVGVLLLGAATAAAQAPPLVAIWGGPSDTQSQIRVPTAIGVDPVTGNVFVGDWDGGRVVVLDRVGVFVRQWYLYVAGDLEYSSPTGIAVDGFGHVYVADRGNNCVKKYTVDGTYLTQWGPNFEIGHPGSLNLPDGLALDANGLIYVADAWNNQVQVFTSDGAFVRAWGSYGSGPGQFMGDYGIAVSGDGRVYVADYTNSRVQVFGLDGTFLSQWGTAGSGAGNLSDPLALTLGPDGTVYVSEIYYNHRIQAFRPDGTFVAEWGSYGAGAGQFNEASDLAVAPDGTLYVADDQNGRVQVFGGPATAAKRSSWGALKATYR